MEALPDPPSVAALLKKTPPDVRTLHEGIVLWRIFHAEGAHPATWDQFRTWGPTGSRFDPHPADTPSREYPDHGVLYASEAYVTAFAEFFQGTRAINLTRSKPTLVALKLTAPLRLIDVTGSWMLKVGGGPQIATGPREQSRKWSRVFHEAFPALDGICYPSSLNTKWIAYALYGRGLRRIPATAILRAPLSDSRLARLVETAERETGYAFI